MPLGIDHFSHSGAADDGNPSWSHAGGASPKGVLVFVIVGDDTTPRISGVTYGGLALTEVSGSPQVRSGDGRDLMVSAYFLGQNVPSGTQTVAVTGSSPDFKHAACFTLTADGDTAVVTTGASTGDGGENPSDTLNLGGETCFCALAGIFDTLDVDDVSPLANWTARSEQDVPTDEDEPAAGVVYSYDIIGSQNVTAGVTAASVIHAMIAVAVRDTDPGEPADTPSITEVDGDNTITSDQTGVEITGTNFDNATVEIRQGALAIEQTVTSQSSTSISIDVVFEIEDQQSLRFGTAELAVINTDEQEDTIEITIVPPSGELYVDVVSPVQDPDQALTADPPAATGDQVHVFGSEGGAAPAGLSINPDLTFEFAPESEPEAFAFRFWDVSDATWGASATRSFGEELDETLIAGASEASGRSLTLSLGASLTLQPGDVEAASRALALSAGLSVAMERGSATARGREISVQTGASADVSLQRGVAESAGRATAVSAGLAVTLERGAAQAAGREIVPEAGGEVVVLLQRGSALARGRQLEPQHGHSLELARGSSRAVGRQLTVIVGDAAEVTLERGSADAEGRTLAVAAAAGPRLARGNASAVGRSLVPLHGQSIALARGSATARGRVLSVFTGIVLQTPVLRPRSRSMTAGRRSVSKTPRYSSRKV